MHMCGPLTGVHYLNYKHGPMPFTSIAVIRKTSLTGTMSTLGGAVHREILPKA